MAGRRHPPPVPKLSQQKSWKAGFSLIEDFLRHLLDGFSGLPAPHQETHLAAGDDALQTPGTPTTVDAGSAASTGDGPSYAYEDHEHAVSTAAPSNSTGTAASEGSGAALMRADATIKQGIVTTKGDLLTHNSTVPARLAIGSDTTLLVADSTQTTGIKWAPVSTAFGYDPADLELLSWIL